MPSTRHDFGNNLDSPGIQQPNGTFTVDAFGLAQAQLTFALDSSPSNLETAIAYYSAGVDHPDDYGFPLKSYKYHIATSKGGVAMMTVDYMGVFRASGYTDPQITGVANTTAQPIETHPNFSAVTDNTIGTSSPTQLLAGKPPGAKATNGNDPIFIPSNTTPIQYQFAGFGVTQEGVATINKKAGIRQFLRPMVNVRGMVFFDPAQGDNVATMVNGCGRTLKDSDLDNLIQPTAIIGAISGKFCLLTSANAECIGNPSNYSAIKVTYDIMIGGELGWDEDIYGQMQTAIF